MRHIIALFAIAVLPAAAIADPPDTNVLIKGAMIVDGTGKPGYKGDVLILKDRVADVGPAVEAAGATVIDGTGLVVCPGFIDLHTHCDPGLATATGKREQELPHPGLHHGRHRQLRLRPGRRGRLLQEARGRRRRDERHPPVARTTASASGSWATPTACRRPSELAKMEALVDKAMKDGAWGLSTGLIYNPGTYSKTDEIVALAKVVGEARRAVRQPHPRRGGRAARPRSRRR